MIENNNERIRVWVYLRREQKVGKPSEDHRRIIIEAAKRHGLPEEYIEKYLKG